MRPNWDQTWMKIALTISERSKCVNRQVGAVIVDVNNRPISMGYNGSPAGLQVGSSCGSFCPRSLDGNRGSSYANCVSVHAEANALLFADRSSYVGGTIYVTNPCCWECAKMVANSGLAKVVVRQSQVDQHADTQTPIDFLLSCGLDVEVWTIIKEEK